MRPIESLIIFLAAAGAGFAQDKPDEKRAPDLAAPVRLTAGGKPILAEGGMASPFMDDIDGDGRLDLLVGDSGGGTAVELPPLTEEQVEARGKIAERVKTLSEESSRLRAVPPNETREARIERQKKWLAAWREWAKARAEEEEFRRPTPCRSYGRVWLYERTPSR